MALPLVPAAAAGLAKLGTALKGLGGAKAVTGALTGKKALAAKKFAGDALSRYMGPQGITPGTLAGNFGYDAMFGVMAGMNTPGDLGDKLIAGVTTGAGGALGGIGAVSMIPGATGLNANMGLRMVGEMGGQMVGDMGGMAVGDALMRVKGGGTTPFEKAQLQADDQYRKQIEQELLAKYGIGSYNQNQSLGA